MAAITGHYQSLTYLGRTKGIHPLSLLKRARKQPDFAENMLMSYLQNSEDGIYLVDEWVNTWFYKPDPKGLCSNCGKSHIPKDLTVS